MAIKIRKTKWWRRFNAADKQAKLEMLRKRCDCGVMGKTELYFYRRKKKHISDGPCEVCGGRANYKHHITPLISGGLNTNINMLNICENCHVEIHTWMVPSTPEYIYHKWIQNLG